MDLARVKSTYSCTSRARSTSFYLLSPGLERKTAAVAHLCMHALAKTLVSKTNPVKMNVRETVIDKTWAKVD